MDKRWMQTLMERHAARAAVMIRVKAVSALLHSAHAVWSLLHELVRLCRIYNMLPCRASCKHVVFRALSSTVHVTGESGKDSSVAVSLPGQDAYSVVCR